MQYPFLFRRREQKKIKGKGGRVSAVGPFWMMAASAKLRPTSLKEKGGKGKKKKKGGKKRRGKGRKQHPCEI